MSLIIEVQGVSKAFGGVVANKEVSLSVKQGGITGLIGPNGSGAHIFGIGYQQAIAVLLLLLVLIIRLIQQRRNRQVLK